MDKALEFQNKMDEFVKALNEYKNPGCTFEVEKGRKFDKVFERTPNQKLGRYMVDRHSWTIYAIKSWNQYNPRRSFGTIDTVNQYDWSGYHGVPKAGTVAEQTHRQ